MPYKHITVDMYYNSEHYYYLPVDFITLICFLYLCICLLCIVVIVYNSVQYVRYL